MAKESSNNPNMECMFTPRFKSAAAGAGWDEEALLIASLVVEDTPERESKHKRRLDPNFKTPPSTNSRRKRRVQRKSPISIPIVHLNLDDERNPKEASEKKKTEDKSPVTEEKKTGSEDKSTAVTCPNSSLPCMDKLREELSCAICLEICFEPSTTPCGHSFCKKCLRSATDKCGKKCPKCRQLISNGRSCTVNTVLWNTMQLLFPQEVEARKKVSATSNSASKASSRQNSATLTRDNVRNQPSSARRRPSQDENAALALRLERENLARLVRRGNEDRERSRVENLARVPSIDFYGARRSSRVAGPTTMMPSQDDDAALALRLQREEFMDEDQIQSRRSLSSARANLRAMASRAVNVRTRGGYL